MNVLSLNLGSDPAGISVGIVQAFRPELNWTVRSLTTKKNYIAYDAETWEAEQARQWWKEADVVHLHHGFVSADRMTRGGFVGGRLQPKPYVLHWHGTGFRENARAHLNEAKDRGVAVLLVSTLDLYLLAPNELEWLPAPIDCDAMMELRRSVKGGKMEGEKAPRD